MRLTCPNCGAQSEVPDEVIPETGRDVQCSNCGDTWFQTHPDIPDAAPPIDLEDDGDSWDEFNEVDNVEDTVADEPLNEQEKGLASELEAEAQFETDRGYDSDLEVETPQNHPEKPVTASRKELKEDVPNVLREEAEREQRAREADNQGGLETQPDLGLAEGEDIERRTQQAKARMARLRGIEPDETAAPDEPEIDLGTRRNLLPEIEDIDQRREAATDGAAEAAAARDGSRVATQKIGPSGFRRGMRLAIVLAVSGTALYGFAPQFGNSVPQLEPPLASYTDMVDRGRAMLQEHLGPYAEHIKAMISG